MDVASADKPKGFKTLKISSKIAFFALVNYSLGTEVRGGLTLIKIKEPTVLLLLWLLFPGQVGETRFLVAQVLLAQINAIHTARRAEAKLSLDLDNDGDAAWGTFLSALWLDPGNATAYAYVGLLSPRFGWPHLGVGDRATEPDFRQQTQAICRKIASDEFEFSKHAVDQSIRHQIRVFELKEAVANGQLLAAYPPDETGSGYLLLGFTQAGRAMHVHCRYSSQPLIKIMAVYEPDSAQWNDDFTLRRTSRDERS